MIIENTVFNSLQTLDGSSFDGSVIKNCIFKGSSDKALYLRDCHNVEIKDCIFTGCTREAIKLASTGTRGCHNVSIHHNYFYNMPSHGILASLTKDSGFNHLNLSISDNEFYNVAYADTVDKNHCLYIVCSGFSITGNLFMDAKDAHAISVRASGDVKYNKIYSAKECGIRYFNSSPVSGGILRIEGNEISASTIGISFEKNSDSNYRRIE